MAGDHLMSDRGTNGFDLALGGILLATSAIVRAAIVGERLLEPLVRLGLSPPLVDPRLHPERLLCDLSDRGCANRLAMAQRAQALAHDLIPQIVSAVLDPLDLTAIVLDRVDLDAVASQLDLQLIIDRVDVNAVVARVDPDPVVARLDLNQIADNIDVDRVAARLDLETLVDRLDVITLALWIIDSINLPGIIRESSSSVASETMKGVRLVSIQADQAVSGVIDRILLRHRTRSTETPWSPANAIESGAGDGAEQR